ncbi:DsbA family protein [Candidatus Micrarchaeota archaeon]|nr:DsbA family protein [Candidatus Micrarchaeota archaeon]
MEHEQHSSHAKQPNAYMLPLTILVAAILICATLLYSSGTIAASINALSASGGVKPSTITASANPSTGAAASPTPRAVLDRKVSIDFSGKPIRGLQGAPTTMVVFDDFQCPFCSKAHPVFKQILSEYNSSVNLVIRHFPLTSIHPDAFKSSEAYECALDQGKQFEYSDKMFDNQQNLSIAALKKYALDLGLDSPKFNSCLDGGQKAQIVQADEDAGAGYGVSGTPSVFLVSSKDLDYSQIQALESASDGLVKVLQEKNGAVVQVAGALPYQYWQTILGALKN